MGQRARARAPTPLEEIDCVPVLGQTGYAVFEPDLDDGRSDDSRIVTHPLSNDDLSDDNGLSRTRLSRDEVEVADGRSADTLSVEGATRREGNGNVGGAVHVSDRETNWRDTRWKITGNPVHCTGDRTAFESLHMSYTSRLRTADGSMYVAGKGTARAMLGDGTIARLSNVLYAPEMQENLLSLGVLIENGVSFSRNRHGYTFYNNKYVVLGRGCIRNTDDYLSSVTHINAFFTGSNEATEAVKPDLLHRRFGHASDLRLNRLANESGLATLTEANLFDNKCEVCILAKGIRRSKHKSFARASRPLERMYVYIWGPGSDKEAINGWKYCIFIVDDFSRLVWTILIKNRDIESVRNDLTDWLDTDARDKQVGTLIVRSENAAKLGGLKPWARQRKIEIELTKEDTPEKMDVAKYLMEKSLETARALLFDARLPKYYWPYAVQTAIQIRNRTVFLKEEVKTPCDVWLGGKQTRLSHLRVWGCKVWFPVDTDDPFAPQREEGALMAYSKDNKYSVLAKRDRKFRTVSQPIFMEDERSFISEDSGENTS